MTADGLMNTLCRGLVAYISYLATCRQSPIYSEAALYEPIARIGRAQGWTVRGEVPVNRKRVGNGDFERIDFAFKRKNIRLGLEVKWAKAKTCHVSTDVRKLREFDADERAVLVFCSGRIAEALKVRDQAVLLPSSGKVILWDAGKTSYAAKWFRI